MSAGKSHHLLSHNVNTGKFPVFLYLQDRQHGIARSRGTDFLNFPVHHLIIVKEPACCRNQRNNIGGQGGDAVSYFIQLFISDLVIIIKNHAVPDELDLTVAFRQIQHLLLPFSRTRPVSFFR